MIKSKHNPLRIIALCLLLATVLPFAVACNKSKGPGHDTTVIDTTDGYVAEYLPEIDSQGYEFRIVDIQGDIDQDIEGEPVTVVDNAIYKRNALIEGRYNLTISTNTIANWWETTELAQKLAGSEAAEYDLITVAINHTSTLILSDDVYAACDLPSDYIDMSRPWHNQSLNDSVTFDGVHFLDFTAFDVKPGGQCLMYNKGLIDVLNLEKPYDLVDSGNWTYDKMWSMMKAAGADLDNDYKWTVEDRYGIVTNYHMMTTLAHLGTGRNLVDVSSGTPVFNKSEGIVNAFMNATENFSVDGVYFDVYTEYGIGKGNEHLNEKFANDESLFLYGSTNTLTLLGDMTSDYGVLPFPKETAEQERYYALSGANIALILTCHPDANFVCAIKEALAVESLNYYYPAYYEQTLKNRYLRDEVDLDYLKLVTDSCVLELGAQFWADYFRNKIAEEVIKYKGTNFASYLESITPQAQGIIDKLMEFVATKK